MDASERRVSQRLSARLPVVVEGSSQPLGKTRDLSFDGLWIDTTSAPEHGSVLSLVLQLPDRTVRLSGQVVRRLSDGIGIEIVDIGSEDQRVLRRFINEFTSVQGTWRTVRSLLVDDREILPVTQPEKIRALLDRAVAKRVTMHVLPEGKDFRDSVTLSGLQGDVLEARGGVHVTAGDRVFVLFTLDFVSYTFAVEVRGATAESLQLPLPTSIAYSERRESDRVAAAEGVGLSWQAPWLPSGRARYAVLDTSPGGLCFRVEGHACALVPGAELPEARLDHEDHSVALRHATVRNIIPKVDGTGAYLRVGVSHGVQRGELQPARVETRPRSWLGRMLQKASELVSYSLHTTVEKSSLRAPPAGPRKVRFKRGRFELVGLLDRTSESDERQRCPLVLVVPGFGGRKEQMSFFANILVQGFRYANEDIAVLRIDGSNNLGESEKDEDCRDDGKHTLHYTISGTVDDVHAALDWARRNEMIDPTHIILMSFSMGSIAVRHVLATAEAADVGLWVSYMGASDIQDAVIHVSGQHLDVFGVQGSLGTCSLIGCLTDGDRFVADFKQLGIGQLTDARREIAKVTADVVWLAGQHDAFMNIDRVRDLMSIRAEGTRELIEVPSGHVPTSGGEAIKQFVEISRRVWWHVHRSSMPAFSPSVGQLARLSQREWKRVRTERLTSREEWWRRYLLGQGGMGFDVLELAEEYADLMSLQARVADVEGRDVLELGAGTGNLTRRLVEGQPQRLVATELVPEVLERLRTKLSDADVLETLQLDAEGSPIVAIRRWLHGDLPGLGFLTERVPGISRGDIALLEERWGEITHAALQGFTVEHDALAADAGWSVALRQLVADIGRLSRLARGEVDVATTTAELERLPPSATAGAAGLPFPDQSFDVVVMSLVLSYIDHPQDLLWECRRVLRPGGRLVLSSMIPDADSSKLYLDLVNRLQELPEEGLPEGHTRESLLASTRAYAESAAELLRLEEEGHFTFYDGPELSQLVLRRGFHSPEIWHSWGEPAQAVVVACERR